MLLFALMEFLAPVFEFSQQFQTGDYHRICEPDETIPLAFCGPDIFPQNQEGSCEGEWKRHVFLC